MARSQDGVGALSAVIIGCGRAGAGHSASGAPTSHAAAITAHPAFTLSSGIDSNAASREVFESTWRARAFESTDALVEDGIEADVFFVSSPTEAHAENLEQLIRLSPRAVLVEKPLTPNLIQSEAIASRFNAESTPLVVNLTRRWDQAMLDLRDEISRGVHGGLLAISATYNGGLLNNGLHLVDALEMLFGVRNARALGPPLDDRSRSDPSVPFALELESGVSAVANCATSAPYSVFDVDIYFERAAVRMSEGGLRWSRREPCENPSFPGFNALRTTGEWDGSVQDALPRVLDTIAAMARSEYQQHDSVAASLTAQKWCETIMETSR